jgi:hypothetical protein
VAKQTQHFKGYDLTSSVLDRKTVVSRLQPGKVYGQSVKTSRYYQLYPVDITITSKLTDDKQLKFSNGASWAVAIHLDPFNVEKEQSEVLECVTPRNRSKETITVEITGGDSATFPLQVDIV